MPPPPKSPVEIFRHWLSLSRPEREQALAGKSQEQRKYFQAKLQEYDSLSAGEREARLQSMQFHWYLRPLMQAPPASRAPRLKAIPESDRKLVEERLKQWDLLSSDLQKEILDNELTLQYFLRLESSGQEQRESILQSLSPEHRKALEEKMERWRALSAERRQKMSRQFQQFFELPPKEKEKTLETLPEAERREMEKTLLAFEKLPPDQRKRCIESFGKLAGMAAGEQAQFLKNAERWQSMSPRERATWRSLVRALPPLPTGLNRPPLPPGLNQPPLPPGARQPAFPTTASNLPPLPAPSK
ncbi:MAG: DUF3106 domain-containing protein [Chloroflexi bacterium]|nr:DUF3106 domain-containing protein [Chloroflexota bacterium]